jgi:hypothetical protein
MIEMRGGENSEAAVEETRAAQVVTSRMHYPRCIHVLFPHPPPPIANALKQACIWHDLQNEDGDSDQAGADCDSASASAGRDGGGESETKKRKTTGERDSDAEQGDTGEVDDSWMRPDLDISRMKPGSSVEVRSEGEWW